MSQQTQPFHIYLQSRNVRIRGVMYLKLCACANRNAVVQPLQAGLNHLINVRDQHGAGLSSDELLQGVAFKTGLKNQTLHDCQAVTIRNGIDDDVALVKTFVQEDVKLFCHMRPRSLRYAGF